jgi:ribosome-associated protein
VAKSAKVDPKNQKQADARRQEHLARVQHIATAGCDRMATKILALDVRGVTSIAETFIIMTGKSARQIGAIGEAIKESTHNDNEEPLGIEGLTEGRWLLFDLNDIIVHVFLPDMRELYDLERLWHDAPRITLDLPEEALAPTPAEGETEVDNIPVQEVYEV